MQNRTIVRCNSITVFLSGVVSRSATAEPPRTVGYVDLERCMGRWYEIAALPDFFQRHCVRDTTADYSLRDDGTIAVTNRPVDRECERPTRASISNAPVIVIIDATT